MTKKKSTISRKFTLTPGESSALSGTAGRLRGLLALTTALAASPIYAGAIVDGITDVRLDADIANAIIGAGVTPSPTGSAGFEEKTLTFSFPITGGELSETVIPGSSIEHDGSGISFAAGSTSLDIGNFVIDTDALTIFGAARSTDPAQGAPLDVDSGVPLFTLALDSSTAPFPLSVSLTADASGVLNQTFGVELFSEGLTIGTARTTAVPEPATLAFLCVGLALIGHQRLRQLAPESST